MKLIDDKGKLFGKINVIDFLVILFFLGLTPMFYYGYKIAAYNQAETPILKKSHYQEFEIIFPNIPKKFIPMISVGDKQYKKNKFVAEMIKIIDKKPSQIKLSKGQFEEVQHVINLENYFDLITRMKLLVTPTMGNFYYQGKLIKVDEKFTFSTDKYSINGTISFPGSLQKYGSNRITISIQVNNLLPEIASAIKIGDKEVLAEKNITIATIKGIIKIENAKVVRFHEGIAKEFENPFYRDVFLDLKIATDESKNEPFFKNKSIKIGHTISFSTNRYAITGTIINIFAK